MHRKNNFLLPDCLQEKKQDFFLPKLAAGEVECFFLLDLLGTPCIADADLLEMLERDLLDSELKKISLINKDSFSQDGDELTVIM